MSLDVRPATSFFRQKYIGRQKFNLLTFFKVSARLNNRELDTNLGTTWRGRRFDKQLLKPATGFGEREGMHVIIW